MVAINHTFLDLDDQEADELELLRADIRAAVDNGDDRRAGELIAILQLRLPMEVN